MVEWVFHARAYKNTLAVVSPSFTFQAEGKFCRKSLSLWCIWVSLPGVIIHHYNLSRMTPTALYRFLQGSSQPPVLYCPYPAVSRSLHQVVATPYRESIHTQSSVRVHYSRTFRPYRPSCLQAMCLAHWHLILGIGPSGEWNRCPSFVYE